MDEIIELVDVSIAFGDVVIVRDLSFSVSPGSLHCVAGRSGSGKTSVLRVAAGLMKPSVGSVSWEGHPIAGLSDDQVSTLRRRLVGYLDQGGVLLSGLTAIENVLLPAVPERRTRELAERARQLLADLGVEDRAGYAPDNLSGGERQRVALARAMLLQPSALIVDEPTAGLDRAKADSVIAALVELASTGIGVLVASHDQHLVDAADQLTPLD